MPAELVAALRLGTGTGDGWPDLWRWVQESGHRSTGIARVEREVGRGVRLVQPVELATVD
jgi:hypothetical protein